MKIPDKDFDLKDFIQEKKIAIMYWYFGVFSFKLYYEK